MGVMEEDTFWPAMVEGAGRRSLNKETIQKAPSPCPCSYIALTSPWGGSRCTGFKDVARARCSLHSQGSGSSGAQPKRNKKVCFVVVFWNGHGKQGLGCLISVKYTLHFLWSVLVPAKLRADWLPVAPPPFPWIKVCACVLTLGLRGGRECNALSLSMAVSKNPGCSEVWADYTQLRSPGWTLPRAGRAGGGSCPSWELRLWCCHSIGNTSLFFTFNWILFPFPLLIQTWRVVSYC